MSVETYTKGIVLPIMRPVPMRIPQPVPWYMVADKFRSLMLRAQPRSWEIMEDYLLEVPWHDHPLCCPKGFIFDGASVPRVLWPFMSPTGIMFLAGLFHDLGYRYDCWFDIDYNRIEVDSGKTFWDNEFRMIGSYVNDATVIPSMAWAGLFLGGFFAWRTRRKQNHNPSKDFPVKIKEF